MRGGTVEFGFGGAIRVLRRLTAAPGSGRFDPAFRRLQALAEFGAGSIPSLPAPVRTFTESFEELTERLARIETGRSLLREKIDIYRYIFSVQTGIPGERADAFFMDFLRTVGRLLEMPDGFAPAFRILDEMCLAYADYRRQRMAEHNGTAEKKARGGASAGGRTAVNDTLRKALASGARAVAVLAWAREPFWTSETLYAGFERRVEDNFVIDAGALESIGDDGKTASVRVDRRLETARRITNEFCRSFVRLGAMEKAKQCEQLLDRAAPGYVSRKRCSPVAFEHENWTTILNGSPSTEKEILP